MKLDKFLNEVGSKPWALDKSKYPELDKLAKDLAYDFLKEINAKAKYIKSEMPYKVQYVLEEVIKILEDAV